MKKNKNNNTPKNSEEFLDAGIEEEDGGDRWLNSGDIAKGVRFYQRAYNLYRQCIDASSSSSNNNDKQDAIYNICRMEYVIYCRVIKPGIYDEIKDQLENDEAVIVKDIINIGKHYEDAIDLLGGVENCNSIDLLYNYGQVLIETGEEIDDLEFLKKGVGIFELVMSKQSEQLKQLEGFTEIQEHQGQEEETNDNQNHNNSNNFGPNALAETLTTYLQGLYLILEDENSSIENFDSKQDHVVEIIDKFNQLKATYAIAPKLIEDMEVIKLQIQGLKFIKNADLDGLIDLIRSQENNSENDIVPRYMIEIDLFLDYITHNAAVLSDHLKWKCYSLALNSASNGLKKLSDTSSTSDPINQIKLWIIKGDLEWLRLNLKQNNFPNAIHNSKTLESNAKSFYTTAINLTKNTLNVNWDIQNLANEARIKKAVLLGEYDSAHSQSAQDLSVLQHMVQMNLIASI